MYIIKQVSLLIYNCLQLYVSKEAIEDMAARGLRCVAIAYRPHEMDSIPVTAEKLKSWKLPETDLVLLAIVGIKVITSCPEHIQK